MKCLRKNLHSLIDSASGWRVLFCFPRSHLWSPALKYLNECKSLRIWAVWRIGTLPEKLTFSSGWNPVVQWGVGRLRNVGCTGLHCGQNDCFWVLDLSYRTWVWFEGKRSSNACAYCLMCIQLSIHALTWSPPRCPPPAFPSKCSMLVIYTLLCLTFVHELIDAFVYFLSAYSASGIVPGGKSISGCFLESHFSRTLVKRTWRHWEIEQ